VESSCDALWLKGIIEYVIGDLCWSVELFSDAEAFAAMSVKTLRRDAGVCDAALALALLSRCRRVRGDYEAAADPAREAWSIARQCRNMAGAKRAAVLLTSLAIALEPQTSDNVIRALQQMTQAAQQFDDNVFRAIIVCEAFRLLENSGLPKPEFWPVLESIKEKSQISCSRGQ
jgi:hypothetical protein